METLSGRLRRYSEKCVSDRLDEDFAKAVQEAANFVETIEYPETNAERIRSMTDEELLEFLYWEADGSGKTPEQWISWLKQEVKQ